MIVYQEAICIGKKLSFGAFGFLRRSLDFFILTNKVNRVFLIGVMWDGDLQSGYNTNFLLHLCFILGRICLIQSIIKVNYGEVMKGSRDFGNKLMVLSL